MKLCCLFHETPAESETLCRRTQKLPSPVHPTSGQTDSRLPSSPCKQECKESQTNALRDHANVVKENMNKLVVSYISCCFNEQNLLYNQSILELSSNMYNSLVSRQFQSYFIFSIHVFFIIGDYNWTARLFWMFLVVVIQ